MEPLKQNGTGEEREKTLDFHRKKNFYAYLNEIQGFYIQASFDETAWSRLSNGFEHEIILLATLQQNKLAVDQVVATDLVLFRYFYFIDRYRIFF